MVRPYLFAGYDHRTAFFSHNSPQSVRFDLEVDHKGTGVWEKLRTLTVPAGETVWTEFTAREVGEWLRVRPTSDASGFSLILHYCNRDQRPTGSAALFDGVATTASDTFMADLIRVRGENKRTLGMAVRKFVNGQQETVGF